MSEAGSWPKLIAVSALPIEIGPPVRRHVVGQERIGDEVSRVDAAEDEAELPDQRPPPIRPPAAVWRRDIAGGARSRCIHRDDQSGEQHRRGPEHQAQPPTVADERQHQRNGQRRGNDFADQQSCCVDRRGKSDLLRKPRAHQRRHRRLHDGNASGHHDAGDVERRYIGKCAAKCRSDGIEQQPDNQSGHETESRDQQRAWHCGDGEQHRRHARQPADTGFSQVKIGMQHRHHRRDREHGKPQAAAGQEQHGKRNETGIDGSLPFFTALS